MSDQVEVKFSGEASDRAVLLLAAAEELGLDASVIRSSYGAFLVPEEVAKKAGFDGDGEPTKTTVAKKAPAKKAATKKAASNKGKE
jgi:hypothetical protein